MSNFKLGAKLIRDKNVLELLFKLHTTNFKRITKNLRLIFQFFCIAVTGRVQAKKGDPKELCETSEGKRL